MEKSFICAKGRINRQPFIIRGIIFLVMIITTIVIVINHKNTYYSNLDIIDNFLNTQYLVFTIFITILIFLFFIQIIKRLKDLNLDWYFIFIPIIFIFIDGFGALLYVLSFVILCAVDGTKGQNKFGADPLNRVKEEKDSVEKLNTSINNFSNFSKEYLSKKYQRFEKNAEIQNSLANIKGANWTLIDEEETDVTYIFRDNEQLLISNDGVVTKAKYEFIIDNNSLLITQNNVTEIFNIVLLKDDLFFISKFSSNIILHFANKTKFKDFVKKTLYKEILNEDKII